MIDCCFSRGIILSVFAWKTKYDREEKIADGKGGFTDQKRLILKTPQEPGSDSSSSKSRATYGSRKEKRFKGTPSLMERVRCGFLLIMVYSLAFVFILIIAPSPNSSTRASDVPEENNNTFVNSQNLDLASNITGSKTDRFLSVGGGGPNINKEALAMAPNNLYEETNRDDKTKDKSEEEIYIVREGDTLSEIGEMFGVSANTIIWANDLRGSKIFKGQHLVILPFDGVRHQVESGDTISKIADKYDASEEEIMESNEIWDDKKLTVGHLIDIPGGVKKKAVEKKDPQPSSYSAEVAYNNQSVSESSGYLMRPVKGGIRTQGLHGRNAVDIAAPTGTYIYAAAEGKVSVSGWHSNTGYGYYIVIDHPNGVSTLYAHHSRNLVGVGQWVSKGEVIAEMGNTGFSTGPHLHFEVHGAANPF